MIRLIFCFVLSSLYLAPTALTLAGMEIQLWLPPSYKAKSEKARKMAAELSEKSGLKIVAYVANSYPEILAAMAEKKPTLAYVGSMAQAILLEKRLGQPLLQGVDGHHFYGGVMLYPKGSSPETILRDNPADVAYTVGATSGEVCAKVATDGKAAMRVKDHREAAESVSTGKAKAAFVKDVWWDEFREKYPKLEVHRLPGVSDAKNPDNVLVASKFVAPEIRSMILGAAIYAPQIFDANVVVPFDSSLSDFTLDLMRKAGIDPLSYTWSE